MFKPGDKVICVDFKDGFGSFLKKDQIYTVKSVHLHEIVIEEVFGIGWMISRFKPAYSVIFNNKLEEMLKE